MHFAHAPRHIFTWRGPIVIQNNLKGLDTSGKISHNFVQGKQLLQLPVCCPAHQVLSEMGSALKGKTLLPLGQAPFQKSGITILPEVSPLKVYQFPLIQSQKKKKKTKKKLWLLRKLDIRVLGN